MAGFDGKGITGVLKVGVERRLTLTVNSSASHSCMRELSTDAAAFRFKEHTDAVHTVKNANVADKAGGIGITSAWALAAVSPNKTAAQTTHVAAGQR